MHHPSFLIPSPLPHIFLRSRLPFQKCHRQPSPKMSGVNGGIDYEIDLSTLPVPLSARIQTIQRGPDSPTELITAAEQIAKASNTIPATLPVLVDMLGFNNPIAANIAIDALVNAGTASLSSLLRGVAAFNYSVNAYALRALGRIGDPSVLDVVLACAIRGPIPNVRRAAVRALGGLKYELADETERAFDLLVRLADGEADWGVRYAALVALEGFECVHMVAEDKLMLALNILREASEGRGGVYVEEADVVEDATVRARAFVALEILEKRVGVIVGV